MPFYRPYVEAVQWTGINVIEIRQFIRDNKGYFNNAIVRNGTLYLQTINPDPVIGTAEIEVPVTNWIVRFGDDISTVSAAVFVTQFTVDNSLPL